jgi:Fic family protein
MAANGRVGRLLITLILVGEKVLSQPLLYVSLYFKQNRAIYYDKLQRVRTDGDWEGWMSFYLTGVREVAAQATDTASKLVQLFTKDSQAILESKRGVQSVTKVFGLLKKKILVTIPETSRILGLTQPTVGTAIERLEKMGVVREVTGKARDRVFFYQQYYSILSDGTATAGQDSADALLSTRK